MGTLFRIEANKCYSPVNTIVVPKVSSLFSHIDKCHFRSSTLLLKRPAMWKASMSAAKLNTSPIINKMDRRDLHLIFLCFLLKIILLCFVKKNIFFLCFTIFVLIIATFNAVSCLVLYAFYNTIADGVLWRKYVWWRSKASKYWRIIWRIIWKCGC